jgi:hypothetical protein
MYAYIVELMATRYLDLSSDPECGRIAKTHVDASVN